ncbi:MAG: tyrosine-type recombinase/integrase [Candidatus Brocadiales bacterium]|nr:tyrosine-type recombinase/integrase [Candidatus Brocadiales bacterium]
MKTKGRQFEPISPFAKYVTSFDVQAGAMPKCPFGNPHTRTTPYIYTELETKQLMDECKNLYSPDGLRKLTMKTAIGLLWATGLRTSELINLKIKDVDFKTNVLYIWNSKFKKDRIVPFSNSVRIELMKYRLEIDNRLGTRNDDKSFFVNTGKRPLDIRAFDYAFIKIRDSIKANPIGYPAVRLMDFRHTFACRTILNWLKNGVDANSKLTILSTFLGHVKPQDTYWYLSATPEILNAVCTRYEKKFGGSYYEN